MNKKLEQSALIGLSVICAVNPVVAMAETPETPDTPISGEITVKDVNSSASLIGCEISDSNLSFVANSGAKLDYAFSLKTSESSVERVALSITTGDGSSRIISDLPATGSIDLDLFQQEGLEDIKNMEFILTLVNADSEVSELSVPASLVNPELTSISSIKARHMVLTDIMSSTSIAGNIVEDGTTAYSADDIFLNVNAYSKIDGVSVDSVVAIINGESYPAEGTSVNLTANNSISVSNIALRYCLSNGDFVDTPSMSLEELAPSGISSSITSFKKDIDAPVFGDITTKATIVSVDGTDYLTANGDYTVNVSDALSGVKSYSISVNGSVVQEGVTSGSIMFPSTILAEGENTISIAVKDAVGNSANNTFSIYVEREVPEISGEFTGVSNLLNSVSYSNSNIQLTLKNNPNISSVSLIKEGSEESVYSSFVNDSAVISDSGTYVVRAEDKVGNIKTFKLSEVFPGLTDSVVVDSELPTCSMTVNGNAVSDSWLTDKADLSIAFSDNSLLKKAFVQINGVSTEYTLNGTINDSVNISLNDYDEPEDGRYTVEVYCEDVSGNISKSLSNTVKYDRSAPKLDISVDGDYVVDSDVLYIDGKLVLGTTNNSSDVGSGIKSTEILKDGSTIFDSVPYTILKDGNYSVKVTDRAGLYTEKTLQELLGKSFSSVVVDTDTPEIKRVTPEFAEKEVSGVNWFKTLDSVSFSVKEKNLKSVKMYIDDTLVEDANVSVSGSKYSVNVPSDGSHVVKIVAEDVLGKSSESSYAYSIDNTSPVEVGYKVTSDYKDSNNKAWFKKSFDIAVSAKDTGIGIDKYVLSDLNSKEIASNTTGEFTNISKDCIITVYDKLGNYSSSKLSELPGCLKNFEVDTTAPTCSVLLNGEEISKNWVTDKAVLNVSFEDNSCLNTAKVTVNGEEKTYSYDTELRSTEDISLNDFSEPADGLYNITITCTDKAGNVAKTLSKVVKYDRSAPEIDLSVDGEYVLSENTLYVNKSITVGRKNNCTDVGSGIKSVELLKDGKVVSKDAPFTISESGNYSVKVTDNAGLSTECTLSQLMSKTFESVVVDTDVPVIKQVTPESPDLVQDGKNWFVELSQYSVSVTDANLKEVKLFVDNSEVSATKVNDTYTISVPTTGSHTIRVDAYDKLGKSSSESYTYYSDKDAPTDAKYVVRTPYTEEKGINWFTEPIEIQVSAVDGGVGIDKYTLSTLESKEIASNTTGVFSGITEDCILKIYDKLGNCYSSKLSDMEGVFKSFAIDSEAPTVTITKPTAVYGNSWYSEDFDLNIKVLDNQSLNSVKVYCNGKQLSDDSFSEMTTADTIVLNTKDIIEDADNGGVYDISVVATDDSGNTTSTGTRFSIDKVAPTVYKFVFTGDGIKEGAEIKGSDRYGFFFKNAATCDIYVSDAGISSGVKDIKVTLTSESGSSQDINTTVENGVATIQIPANFKGFVSAVATDNVGNASTKESPDGVITEDSNCFINSTGIDIQLPETKYSESGRNLYNSDISAKAIVKSSHSGIKSVSWGIGSETMGVVNVDSNGGISGDSADVNLKDKNLVVNLSKMLSVQQNANNIRVWVSVVDRAGNTSTSERFISIDKDAPIISVNYSSTNDSKYYNANRTATITVKERNFNPDAFSVSGVAGVLGTWANVGGDTWTNTLTFSEDKDYQFSLDCIDLAGNKATTYTSESFTIDKTAPVVSVNWNTTPEGYKNQDVVATITVNEHNFDASRFKVDSTGTPGSWSNNGDIHTLVVVFSANGEHSLSVSGNDLAGNASNTYTSSKFIIDKDAPAVTITGVQNGVSYKNDVGFSVSVSDKFIDTSKSFVSLVGRRNGNVDIVSLLSETTGTFSLDNLPKEERFDDLYTLTVHIVDKAGNVSEQKIVFSVNRFGSAYSFANQELLNTYINKLDKDIVLTETNVDKLDLSKIVISVLKDGKEMPIDSKYLSIQEDLVDGKYRYTYTINKDAFSEDGKYLVQIYSQAEDGTKYTSVSQEYSFIIDTVAPDIIVSGIESKKTYNEYSRKVTIDVRDKSGIKDLKAKLNGKSVKLKEENGLYVLEITESKDYQNLEITAVDLAGNESSVSIEKFLISTNTWTILTNQNWFNYLLVGGGAALAAIIALILSKISKSRKKENELFEANAELYKQSSSVSTEKDLAEELDTDETSQEEDK